jgi:hypothetical protein
MKTLGLILFTLALSMSSSAAPLAQGRGHAYGHENSGQGRGNGHQNGANGNPVHSVPEPSTLLLLGAAAGVVGLRKISQQRRGGEAR